MIFPMPHAIENSLRVQPLVLRQGSVERRACFAVVKQSDLQIHGLPPESFLSESELARFHGFQFLPKKQSFLLGRLAAKQAIAALLSEPDLRRIEIHPGIFEQPVVHHPLAGSMDVTISHSHGVAVALAHPQECPMGVDLETVSAASAGVILDEMAPSAFEKAWLAQERLDPETACGVLWTAREALGKLLKVGLSCPLATLSLGDIRSVDPGTWVGHYQHFLQCKCLSRAIGGSVLSLAVHRDVELSSWPILG